MQRDADRYLMAEFVPAGVLVTEKLELVQFRGKTGPFFEPSPGFASLELLNMLKAELVAEVKNAIDSAKGKKEAVRKENISLKINDEMKRIALEVIPMPLPSTGERYFILLFEDMDSPAYEASKRRRDLKRASRPREDESKELTAVRAELTSTKEYLQSMKEDKEASTEELKAANEEILSSNEELQSTNEELHSAKEELQSTNEELLTVNEELKLRNHDLSFLNDDLSNLFNSINSAMILLTKDLRVRRFTPMAETLFRLLPGDIGRSIADIRPSVEIKDMEKLLLEVIATAIPQELEIEDNQGLWFALQMKPYRTQDDRIDGAVLLFTDITQLKTSLIYSEAVESFYVHPLLVLGGDLKVKRANRKFYEIFKESPSDTENRFIYDLGSGQWNIPELRNLLEKILPQSSNIANFKVTHDFPKIGRQTMNLSARRLFYNNTATETILLSVEPIE
jgi:two-component system CheB/CheR fusion protein